MKKFSENNKSDENFIRLKIEEICRMMLKYTFQIC